MALQHHDFDEFGELLAEITGDDPTEGDGSVDLDDVLSDAFVDEHTDAASIDGFFAASSWDVESGADFEGIPESELDAYVAEHGDFSTWEDMLAAGATTWIRGEAER